MNHLEKNASKKALLDALKSVSGPGRHFDDLVAKARAGEDLSAAAKKNINKPSIYGNVEGLTMSEKAGKSLDKLKRMEMEKRLITSGKADKAAKKAKEALDGAKSLRKRTLIQGLLGGTAAGVGSAALLAKLLKSKGAANAVQKSKLTDMLKKHKKPLMIGGGAVAGAAGLGALLSNK